MYDYGWLSCGQHEDSLIWLNLPVIRCAASEPCWLLLPIRAQWTNVPARMLSHMPNSEHSAGNSGPACPLQSGLSSPVLLRMQEVCLGRAELLQLKITGHGLLKKKYTTLPISSLLCFPGRACRGNSVMITFIVAQFSFFLAPSMHKGCGWFAV